MNFNVCETGQYNIFNHPPPNYNNYNRPPPNFNEPPPNYNIYHQPPPNFNQPPPNYNNYNLPPTNYNQPPPNYINYNLNQPLSTDHAPGRVLSACERNGGSENIINAMYQSYNSNQSTIEPKSDGQEKKCLVCAETYIPDIHCVIPNFCVSCGRSVKLKKGTKYKVVSKARCKVCNAIFASHHALHQHQNEFKHRFKCQKCGKPFYRIHKLMRHIMGCKRNKKKKNRQKKKDDDVVLVQEFSLKKSPPPVIDITEDVKYERTMEPQASRFSINWNATANTSESVNESNIDDRSKKKPKSKARQKPKQKNKSGLHKAGGKRRTGTLDTNELATLICNCCSKKFDTKHGLKMHKELVKATIKCDACGKTFDRKQLYNEHACMFAGHVASDHVTNLWLSDRNREWTPGKNLVWVAPNKSFVPGRNRVWVRGQNNSSNTDAQS